MSETITIPTVLDVDVTISTVSCSNCNGRLSFDAAVNRDNDLSLTVDRCDCQDDDMRADGADDERSNHTCEKQSKEE